MGKGLAGWISFSPGDRVNGSVRLVLPFAFFCYVLARRGLCLCVLVWPGGIIIRGMMSLGKICGAAWCRGELFPLPTWRVTGGKWLTFFSAWLCHAPPSRCCSRSGSHRRLGAERLSQGSAKAAAPRPPLMGPVIHPPAWISSPTVSLPGPAAITMGEECISSLLQVSLCLSFPT